MTRLQKRLLLAQVNVLAQELVEQTALQPTPAADLSETCTEMLKALIKLAKANPSISIKIEGVDVQEEL